MIRFFTAALLVVCLALTSSCSAYRNYNRRDDFERNVKTYNRMLRWHEVETAGMRFMDPDGRDLFLATAESIKKRGVSIIDFRILTTECLPEKGTGDAVVEFDYYIMPSNRLKTVTYRQKWAYRDTETQNGWKVKSSLPEFE
ncbi:MAG TPA: hypothetical protein PLN25_04265 [Deltaproteobacteria bacterium]|nr:hypothetical protein [Deltaproteobacteria bacterium]HQB39477.1 hypothetical protein [Deltaproteobacteria bacterium]